jgi:catechol 2,3-dioxygenase-like lactoylglutathione lyase family enzyme
VIRGIHHTAISTPDIDRAIAFYRDLLGFEVLVNGGWPRGVESVDTLIGLKDSAARMAMLRKGNAMLELFEFESPAPAPGYPHRPVNDHGLTHICLDVTDLGSEYARLKGAGMFFHSAPVGTGDSCGVYGRDPDGNVIEFMELGSPDHPMALSLDEPSV